MNTTMTSHLNSIMDIMDNNKENISDRDYLDFCNLLKNVYDNQSNDVNMISEPTQEEQIERDIITIMEHSNSSRNESIIAFNMYNNVDDAILELTMPRRRLLNKENAILRNKETAAENNIKSKIRLGDIRLRNLVVQCISDNSIEIFLRVAYRFLLRMERNKIIIQTRRVPHLNDERNQERVKVLCRGFQHFIDLSNELKKNSN